MRGVEVRLLLADLTPLPLLLLVFNTGVLALEGV